MDLKDCVWQLLGLYDGQGEESASVGKSCEGEGRGIRFCEECGSSASRGRVKGKAVVAVGCLMFALAHDRCRAVVHLYSFSGGRADIAHLVLPTNIIHNRDDRDTIGHHRDTGSVTIGTPSGHHRCENIEKRCIHSTLMKKKNQ